MHSPKRARAIVEQVREQAGVEAVFGDPVTAEGRTVIPVARVSYGFGGGFGPGAPGGPRHEPNRGRGPGGERGPKRQLKRGLKRRLKGGDDHEKKHERGRGKKHKRGCGKSREHGKKRGHGKHHKHGKEHEHGHREAYEHRHGPSSGSGGGMGGGVTVKPVGAIELTSDGTRFVPITPARRLLAALGVGAVVGYALARRERD